MKNNLQFDFIVDKEKNTLSIVREFNAERQLVWDCYTKQELLDQWFAPKPFTTKTKSMDFSNDYYRTMDAFCDSEAKINEDLPRAKWLVAFNDKGENSTVTTVVTYDSLNDLETITNMGMEEGMIATLEKLDELLATLKK